MSKSYCQEAKAMIRYAQLIRQPVKKVSDFAEMSDEELRLFLVYLCDLYQDKGKMDNVKRNVYSRSQMEELANRMRDGTRYRDTILG